MYHPRLKIKYHSQMMGFPLPNIQNTVIPQIFMTEVTLKTAGQLPLEMYMKNISKVLNHELPVEKRIQLFTLIPKCSQPDRRQQSLKWKKRYLFKRSNAILFVEVHGIECCMQKSGLNVAQPEVLAIALIIPKTLPECIGAMSNALTGVPKL